MSSDKSIVLEKIKHNFKEIANLPNNIRLPRDIDFAINGNSVEMILSSFAVCRNMQEDQASFEGWSLVLKRWAKFQKIVLSWEKPDIQLDSPEAAHYQRFLFRLKHFSEDFKDWFEISSRCLAHLVDAIINDQTYYYLSPPYNERNNSTISGKESVLEYKFSLGQWSESLKQVTNAKYLNRQLPVGVFHHPVSNKTKIFPKNKSAIDIWGIGNNNELLIFELKADGNNKIGIISELYFYCHVMESIRKGHFRYEKYSVENLDKLAATITTVGYFFSPALHPLIDEGLINIINVGTKPEISFHYLKFSFDGSLSLPLYSTN